MSANLVKQLSGKLAQAAEKVDQLRVGSSYKDKKIELLEKELFDTKDLLTCKSIQNSMLEGQVKLLEDAMNTMVSAQKMADAVKPTNSSPRLFVDKPNNENESGPIPTPDSSAAPAA